MSEYIHRITVIGVVLTFAVGMLVAVIMHGLAQANATPATPPWSRAAVVAASEIAREGAQDCSTSLRGPTESDDFDVAECVDGAIARAFGVDDSN
jgi:hypothetical protein